MTSLPDFEAMAIFATVVQQRSFSGAAKELSLSNATVSKAVSRLEARLGARLLNRTTRQFALTEAGRRLAVRATSLLAEGESAEDEAATDATAPRGTIRLAAPMSFGVRELAPLLPEFFTLYPAIKIDLHLSDAAIDLVGEGFDAALRIAALPDSSLVAKSIRQMPRFLVAAPSMFKQHERPRHPLDLASLPCLTYTRLDAWRFTSTAGEVVAVKPSGPLRANTGDGMMPLLHAGMGIAVVPEFMVVDELADGRVERLLDDWSLPGGAIHWVTPPGTRRHLRVNLLGEYLAAKLAGKNGQAGDADPQHFR